MNGYIEPEGLKRWWPTMPVMHACAHSTTLQVGPHLAATYFCEVAKAVDVCSTLSEYITSTSANAAPQRSLPDHQIFLYVDKYTKRGQRRCMDYRRGGNE